MASVKSKPLRLRVSDKAQIEATRALLQVIREQCADGVSASGERFPGGKGAKKELDMSATGRLLSDVTVFPSRLNFNAPYAGAVQARFNFAGLAPQYQERFEELLRQALAGGDAVEVE